MVFRLIQIDPETLAIYINVGAIARHSKSARMMDFIDKTSAYGADFALRSHFGSFGFDLDIMEFGASLVHEVRHFADLLLSPFGFYRIRTAFEFYTNFPYLIWSSDSIIPVPLMSGMDPINRKMLGLGTDFLGSAAHQMGRTSLTRARLINSENEYDHNTGAIKIGGDRILEGLAYIGQFEYLFNYFDGSDTRSRFPEFFSDFTGSPFDLAYRWFTPTVHELHPNEKMPNNRLINAILFASLCGHTPVLAKTRTGGQQPQVLPYRDVSNQLPSYRYNALVTALLKAPRPSLQTDEEAFFEVNKICVTLFGKSIFQEIEDDILHTRERITSPSSGEVPDGIPQLDPSFAYRQLLSYREKVFNVFKKTPTLFTSPNQADTLTQLLRPSIIYATPQGMEPSQSPPSYPRRTWVSLLSRETVMLDNNANTISQHAIYCYWSPQAGELGHDIGIEDAPLVTSGARFRDDVLSSLQTVYGVYAPIYRYILYGKRYLSMVEVENHEIDKVIGLDANRFVRDEYYDRSNDITKSDSFAKFFGKESYLCDICGDEISSSQGFIVSARTVRQNERLFRHLSSIHNLMGPALLNRDWSDWFICKSDMIKWSFEIPEDD